MISSARLRRISALFAIAWALAGPLALAPRSALADGAVAVPADSQPAQATQAAQASSPQNPPGMLGMLTPFLMMAAVFYFLMIRPQQKKMKDQQALLSNLKTGDEVVTASGMLGTITGVTEKVVTLEVANNVRIKMLKSQVAQVIKGSINDLAVQ